MPEKTKRRRGCWLIGLLLIIALVVLVVITTAQGDRLTRAPSTPSATSTPVPPPPTPTPAVPLSGPPVTLSGRGQSATDPIRLPSSISRARFTHDGSANFIVTAYQADDQDILINEIGPYQGTRPLFGTEPVLLDIAADGAWSVRIEGIPAGGPAAFSGQGDDVSALFDPPPGGPWAITHAGQANFIIFLHCLGGSSLVQNEIGPIDGSRVINFSTGPCLWEVQADGAWSLAPR